MKIRKAEDHEKANYNGLYQLFGYVTVPAVVAGTKTRFVCAVEYLGEGKDNPNYEAIAPKGMKFDGEVHTLLGCTQRDLLDRLFTLTECSKDCDCKAE